MSILPTTAAAVLTALILTTFDPAVNLRTAKAPGLTLSPPLVLRADEVIR